MNLEQLAQADLENILNEHNHVITYNGNEIGCHVGKINKREDNKLEGIWEDNDIEILASQYAINPNPNELITHKSKQYRIVEIINDDYGASILIRCKAEAY